MKSRFFFVIFLGYVVSSIAQTGPGGVGSSTSNILWLEADEITALADDDDIPTWSDGSGNGNDLSQPTASLQPVYKTNILNGYPVVRFNKANGRIVRTGFAGFPTTAITEIYVNINSENLEGILSYASASSDNDFLLYNSSNLAIYRGTEVNSGVSFADNTFHIANASWRSSDGDAEIWQDGTQSFTTTAFRTGTSITAGGCLALAGEQDAVNASYDPTQTHFGDFPEVIIYNTYLNTAQHIIVANYLAAKYNLSISNDRFAFEATHEHDVAGIGREDVSNIHTAAMSADVLQIENASGIDADQEYLLFGHDDADITTTWTTTEAPNGGTDIQRLAREWRLDETGDMGTVDFIVDIAAMPALPVGHAMYALMVDTDGDFSNGASVYELTLSAGTEYTVTGVDINDGDFVAIAAVNPTVQHTVTTSSDFEPSNAVIEVSLNFISQSARTVDYTTADGTALVAQPDYTAATGVTLNIAAASSTATYTITITNDAIVESDETFTGTLSNPSVGISLGANAVHTYTIHDDDDARKVYYTLATSSGDEGTTPATITLAINNVDAVNPTTVDYSVTGGTATGGSVDYTFASGTVTFPTGVTTGSFNIVIDEDALHENDETIIITLTNPTNCNLDGVVPLGGTGFISHTYTILDNDAAPEIQFNSTTSTGAESVLSVNFQVDLNVVSGIDASATYTLTGTATGGGTDYTLANGTVTVTAGNTTTNITATIVDDIIDELSETMILTLTAPTDATLGINTVHTYTITDNDEFGHLGPGGVGQSTNNKLWTKSNDLAVVADGTDITSWADASGNSHDLTQANTSFTPRYYANVLNSQPVVRFEQSDNRIVHNSFTDFPTDEITTIFVNSNAEAGNDALVSYASSGALNNDYLLFGSNSLSFFRGSSVGTGVALNGSTFRIVSNTWRSSDGDVRLYRNGTQSYSGTFAAGTSITAGGTLAIAGEQDGVNSGYDAAQSHQGDFTEIIMYCTVLNSARRKIVDNYLSAKYNIAIANDLFSFDAPGNYENEVAGIGRDDASNWHRDAQGTALVRINTPSSLDDGDYLLWGHDGASFSSFNTTDVPGSVDNRMERIWRVDETGDIGTVTLDFDVSNFTVGSSSDLILLIDTDDGNFINASSVALSSFAGNVATFSGVNFAAGNWFTIASSSSSNTLPIELLHFKATLNNGKVDLDWATASETNNDYFTIERSDNARTWEEIIKTKGAGNSIHILEYSETDFAPLAGTSYYRLKQTDFNHQFQYSQIAKVNNESVEYAQVLIYPNPTNNEITIEGREQELNTISIYNVLGKNVTALSHQVSKVDSKLVIDLSRLNTGIYYIKTKTTTSRVYKQ